MLESTLTEEQLEKLNAHHETRRQAFYDALLQYLVSQIAYELLLDEEQRVKFSELVAAQADYSKLEGLTYVTPEQVLLSQAAKIDENELKSLFSEQQRQQWMMKTRQVSYVDQMLAMAGEE